MGPRSTQDLFGCSSTFNNSLGRILDPAGTQRTHGRWRSEAEIAGIVSVSEKTAEQMLHNERMRLKRRMAG